MLAEDFLNQATHNEAFHLLICNGDANDFFDWKTTCLFYIAIHYLKALAKYRNIEIGSSHTEINKNINKAKPKAAMPLQDDIRDDYMILYRYSRISRYTGFADKETFQELMKNNYEEAVECLERFKQFVQNNITPLQGIWILKQ